VFSDSFDYRWINTESDHNEEILVGKIFIIKTIYFCKTQYNIIHNNIEYILNKTKQ